MAPDGDRQNEDLKRETYFLSNIVPQAGKRFNSTLWLALEKQVRKWAVQRGVC